MVDSNLSPSCSRRASKECRHLVERWFGVRRPGGIWPLSPFHLIVYAAAETGLIYNRTSGEQRDPIECPHSMVRWRFATLQSAISHSPASYAVGLNPCRLWNGLTFRSGSDSERRGTNTRRSRSNLPRSFTNSTAALPMRRFWYLAASPLPARQIAGECCRGLKGDGHFNRVATVYVPVPWSTIVRLHRLANPGIPA